MCNVHAVMGKVVYSHVLLKGALHHFSTYVHIIGPHSKIAFLFFILFLFFQRAVGRSETHSLVTSSIANPAYRNCRLSIPEKLQF